MSMLIAWNVLNKIANPKRCRFSKNILIVTPGITVKDRLSVLFHHKKIIFIKHLELLMMKCGNNCFKQRL
jgi:hypothetical protein